MSTEQSELAVDAQGLARRFGARWVLRGLSFQLAAGEIVGVLGANGSGKTTLLRMLGTLLRPSAGIAHVAGHDVTCDADAVRRCVGFLSHVPGLYDDLTARENLKFAAMMQGLDTGSALDDALERVGLNAVAHERTRGFSAGMQRRLALARLILRRPRVLLLDEPYANLDVDGISLINGFVTATRAEGGAALVVLHELAPATDVLDRTITIVNGKLADAHAAPVAAGAMA